MTSEITVTDPLAESQANLMTHVVWRLVVGVNLWLTIARRQSLSLLEGFLKIICVIQLPSTAKPESRGDAASEAPDRGGVHATFRGSAATGLIGYLPGVLCPARSSPFITTNPAVSRYRARLLRRDLRRQLVGVSEPLAPVEGQGEGQRAANVVRIGERRGEGSSAMRETIEQVGERSKNGTPGSRQKKTPRSLWRGADLFLTKLGSWGVKLIASELQACPARFDVAARNFWACTQPRFRIYLVHRSNANYKSRCLLSWTFPP